MARYTDWLPNQDIEGKGWWDLAQMIQQKQGIGGLASAFNDDWFNQFIGKGYSHGGGKDMDNQRLGAYIAARQAEQDDDIFDNPQDALAGMMGFGVGGLTGASLATGNVNQLQDLEKPLMGDFAGLLAGAGLAGMMAPAAGGGVTAGAAAGQPISSTVGGTNLFGTASTPAMTTYAGPNGTAIGGYTAPAAMGGDAGAATAIPISNLSSGITETPIENVAAPSGSMPAGDSIYASQPGVGDAGAMDQFGSAAYPEAGSNMTIFGDPAISGAASGFDLASMAETGLPIAGSLYQMYQADQSKDAYEKMLAEMNSNQYDYRQNDDLVQEYLRNPMGLMKNHPGYQASVDFLTKKGSREMAAKGMTGSGNIGYYLADTLGKNASEWHKNLWNPISESAGLANYPNRAALGQVGTNAQTQIDNAQRNAAGEIFRAGSKTLPDIFKWAFS